MANSNLRPSIVIGLGLMVIAGCGQPIQPQAKQVPAEMSLSDAHDFHVVLCTVAANVDGTEVIIDGFPRTVHRRGIEKHEIIGRWQLTCPDGSSEGTLSPEDRFIALEVVEWKGGGQGERKRTEPDTAAIRWRGHVFEVELPGSTPQGHSLRMALNRALGKSAD